MSKHIPGTLTTAAERKRWACREIPEPWYGEAGWYDLARLARDFIALEIALATFTMKGPPDLTIRAPEGK